MRMRNDHGIRLEFWELWFSPCTPGGEITVTEGKKEYEPAPCGHCEGYGCTYCNKTGIVLVRAPKKPCRHCEGVGCLYCGFTGWTDPKGKYD